MHSNFTKNVIRKIEDDEDIVGLAVGGSWITQEIDEYSDLDLILVSKTTIAPAKTKMIAYAEKFGDLINAFTGEHVGENRLLICFFDNPLIHVDIKFITPDELYERVENPKILWERDNQLTRIIQSSEPKFPMPDLQWLEDRFWIWIHYVTCKIGRGEYFEALDSINYLRSNVIAQLLHLKNNNLPKGLRKVEFSLPIADRKKLEKTVALYNRSSIIESFENIINIYRDLRTDLFTDEIKLQLRSEKKSIEYFEKIKGRSIIDD